MNIPLENKYLIQSSYVRYRELSKLAPEVGKQVSLAQWCFWGGIGVFVVWLIQVFMNSGFSAVPAGFAAAAFFIGLILRSDSLPKQRRIWAECREIEDQMEKIGVIFSGLNTRVSVYFGEISSDREFNPLRDADYG